MSFSGRTYTRGAEDQKPSLVALQGVEKYVRGLIEEVNTDLKDLDDAGPVQQKDVTRHDAVRARLLGKKHALKDILQYIKDERDT